jgi:uncharacterized RDD family membrane protein YckC
VPASRWREAGLPPEIAAQLDPEALDLTRLSLPQAILETEAQAGVHAAPAANAGAEASAAGSYGGLWLRGMAALVDAVLAGGLALLAGAAAVAAAAGGARLAGGLDLATAYVAGIAALLAAAGVSLAYHTLFGGAWGQTPGKMLFGLTLARADGGAPGYGQAACRWIASWVGLGLLGLGPLLVAVTRRKQGLHDLLAGTVVLRESTRSP